MAYDTGRNNTRGARRRFLRGDDIKEFFSRGGIGKSFGRCGRGGFFGGSARREFPRGYGGKKSFGRGGIGKSFGRGGIGKSFGRGDRGRSFGRGDRGRTFGRGDRGRTFGRGDRGGSFGRCGSGLQTEEGIISKCRLLGGEKKFITFIKKYRLRQEYENFSNVCGFICPIDKKKSQISSQTIANFVNEGAKLLKGINGVGFDKEDKDTFKKIAKRIGELIVDRTIKLDTFNSIDIANTFNGLGQCGVNLSEYFETEEGKKLKNEFIRALVDRIQVLLLTSDFDSQALANTFNGLAKCGVNLSGYLNGLSPKDKNEFIRVLVGRIQDLLNEPDLQKRFNSQALANTFNGLAKCGVNLSEYLNGLSPKDKNEFIRALVGRIQDLLNEPDLQKRFNSQALANTFNGLGQCGVNLGEYFETEEGKKLKNEFIRALVDRIQVLLLTSDFNSQALANTFNGLAKCGVNLSEYLNGLSPKDKNEFIRALVGRIQVLLNEPDPQKQFKPQELANTFNGLAQCGVNLSGYVNDAFIRALVGRIQYLLPTFSSIDIANTFNGLAQCGVNLSGYVNDAFIGALVTRIQVLLNEPDLQKRFNSQALANTFNGLVTLFLYNEDLCTKNKKHFQGIINNTISKYFEFKLSDRNKQSDWTILNNIQYLTDHGFQILSKIPNIGLGALDDKHIKSALERNFETFLSDTLKLKNKTAKTRDDTTETRDDTTETRDDTTETRDDTTETEDDCYKPESKLTFQVTSTASFKRSIDFCIEFELEYKGKKHKYRAYIELDGPIHFTDTKQTQKTPRTQIRDILTLQRLQEEQETLSKNGDETQILYVTLSANEFDEIRRTRTTKEDFFDFLIKHNQLKSTPERTSDSSEMTDEDKGMPQPPIETNHYHHKRHHKRHHEDPENKIFFGPELPPNFDLEQQFTPPLPTGPYPTPTPPPPPPTDPYPTPIPPPPPPTESYPDGSSSKMTDTDNYATPTSKPMVSNLVRQAQQEQRSQEVPQARKRTWEEMNDPLGLGAIYGSSDDESMEQNESTKAEQGVKPPASKKPRQVVGNDIPCPRRY